MKNRTQASYEKVLQKVCEILSEELKNVESILLRTDNEPGAYQAWAVIFGPNGLGKKFSHKLCFFHWRQAIRRKFEKVEKNFDTTKKGSRNWKYYIWASYLPLLPVPILEFLKNEFISLVPEMYKG